MIEDDQIFQEKLLAGKKLFENLAQIPFPYLPRKMIDQHHNVKLYHYQSALNNKKTIPLLIVFATINRPEILELMTENSLIGRLLKQGLDIYLLDWGYPSDDDHEISMGDYVTDYLNRAVRFIVVRNKIEQINLLGICQGGILSLCYASLFSHIKNLILISTPIDFHTKENVVAKLINHIEITKFFNHNKNVSGAWLTQFFILLSPFKSIAKKYFHFLNHMHDELMREKFLRVEKWLQDAPNQPRVAFLELLKDFYQENKLIHNEIKLYGRKVNLTQLNIPILNIMAKEDQIVPISASRALKKMIPKEKYTERIFSSGHIGIYLNDQVCENLATTLAEWLRKNA